MQNVSFRPKTLTETCTTQLCMDSSISSTYLSGFTCSEVDQLKLKGNPDRFGKQEDGAAGLGVQVQIELHHVRV